jgi:hypothetical protein
VHCATSGTNVFASDATVGLLVVDASAPETPQVLAVFPIEQERRRWMSRDEGLRARARLGPSIADE